MGLGVDLVEIERLERALARHPRLAKRLFSPEERAYAAARRRPARHLAARFAAKEATVKALGLRLGLADVEVVAGPPPRIRLHGRAAQAAEAQGVRVDLSLTHSREVGAAVALTSRM